MNIPERLTKEEARAWLIALDADPVAVDWGNVRAVLAAAEKEAAEHPELVKGLPVEKTLAILRAHVAYLDAADDGVRDVTYIVWTAPEPEAGLSGERAEVHLFGANAEDDASVRKGLAETFGWIWGLAAKHVHVEAAEEPAAANVTASPPDKPTTGGGARAAMLAAAHDALAALKRFGAAMEEHEDAAMTGDGVADYVAYLRAGFAGVVGMIEGRLPPVERTPEVVLRAMLLDAEKEALRMGVDEITGKSYPTSFRDAEEKASRIRRVLAAYLACGVLDLGGFDYGLCSQEREDYEARLRGDRLPMG